MKKIIVALIILLSLTSNAQIKVSEHKEPELIGELKLAGKLQESIEKNGDLCIFMYRDEKYTTVDEYKNFYFKYSDLETMYNLFTADEEKGTKKDVKLERGSTLIIEYKKSMGSKYISVAHIDKAGIIGLFSLNIKQVNKVFGKK